MKFFKYKYMLAIFVLSLFMSANVWSQNFPDCPNPLAATFSPGFNTSTFNLNRQVTFSTNVSSQDCVYTLSNSIVRVTNPPEGSTYLWSFNSDIDNQILDLNGWPDGTYEVTVNFSYTVRSDGYPEFHNFSKSERTNFTLGGDSTPPGNVTDVIAPSIAVTGIPSTIDERNNLKGTLNVGINVTDNISIKAIKAFGFGNTWVDNSDVNSKSFSRNITLDTTNLRDASYTISITAIDDNENPRTFNATFRVNNNGSVNPTPDPDPVVPDLPVEPPVVEEGGDTIADLMNILVQLISQLMQMLTNLNLNNATARSTDSSLDTLEQTATFLKRVVRLNRKELKKIKQTRKVPKLTRKLNKNLRAALSAEDALEKLRFTKKSQRNLNRILRRLQ